MNDAWRRLGAAARDTTDAFRRLGYAMGHPDLTPEAAQARMKAEVDAWKPTTGQADGRP